MQQWEYKVTTYTGKTTGFLGVLKPHDLQSWLNEMGKSGWELCVYYPSGGQYTFKRLL